MKSYVALLRAVNVGGNNKIEMAKLKKTFENLGFENVKTFIASGNIIFQTKSLAFETLVKKIESEIEKDFKIKISVLLLYQQSLGEVVKVIPNSWVNDKNAKCDVMFLWKEIDNKNILKQLPFDPKIEDVRYIPGAVLWKIDRSVVTKSKMFKIVGTKLHKQMTVRNPNTVRKIYALMQSLHPLKK